MCFYSSVPLLLIALASLIWIGECAEYAYTVHVPGGRVECYFQNITDPKYANLEIDFQVIDGGDLNINFIVKNPQNTVIAHFMQRTDGTQRVDVTELRGDYQICFDNSQGFQIPSKTVFFEIFLYDADGNLDEDDMTRFGFGDANFEEVGLQAESFTQMSGKIKGNLNKAEHFQALLKAWEARDRAIMESNINRVTFWSIANTLVLLCVGMVQVYTIRNLFEDKTRVATATKMRT